MASNAIVEQQAHDLKFKAQTLNNAHEALKASGIIPDVLTDFTPTCRLQVLYPKAHREVLLGNPITPEETQVRSSSPHPLRQGPTPTSIQLS